MDETLLHTEALGVGQIVTKNYDHVLEIPSIDENSVPTIDVRNSLKNFIFCNFLMFLRDLVYM
jgi:hypothetical protein